jgi:hypothetical protein
VLVGALGAVAPAHAAPAQNAAATANAAPATAPTDGGRPVQIEVRRFDPRSLSPTAVITISGTLTNTGDATVSHLALRLQRGPAYNTRAELAAADRSPDPALAVVPAFRDVPGQLQPGDSVPFTYMLPVADLQLDLAGVYPAMLSVNGTVQGTARRVGQLATYLVEPPSDPTVIARTSVAWLWPLVDSPHRDASGRFTDDVLAREVAANGRLDRALAAMERLPRTTPAGGQPTAAVPVTLAVDPALVESLAIMAAGPYQAGGSAGTGTQAAASFLQRLKAVAAAVPVMALPYGDPDVDALQSAGLPGVVTRSLPGSPDGTARDDGASGAQSSTTSASPPSAANGEGTDGAAGSRILSAVLGIHPRTDVAWLPAGSVRPETLATLQKGAITQVVLPSAALAGGDAALGLDRTTATAATTVATTGGSLRALVGDGRLGSLADAGQAAGGPRVAEQRYLAELALLSLQTPAGGATPTVLVTPPRTVDADPDAVAAMMTDATTAPWLQPASVESLATGPAAGAGPPAALAAPGAPALDPSGLATLTAAATLRDAVAGAAVHDAAGALAPYDAAIARNASVEWRADATGFRAAARDLRATMTQLADRVTLVAPADGTYSLASNNAPLVLTVRNDLPFAVQVRLQLRTTNVGLQLGDIGRQTLQPGQRATLQVPTDAHHVGGFTVVATLTTPSGKALGDPVQIRVKTTAYGPIGLIITIGAGALLGLLFLRRLIRFILRRRRGTRSGDGPAGPAPEGAALPLPPTRSPV